MATDLTPVDIALTGTASAEVAADVAGNTFTNTGAEFAVVINGSGISITVTADAFPSGATPEVDGLVVTDPTVTIAAGATKRIGPFRKRVFNNASNKVLLTYSAVTTVTVGIYRLTPAP